MLTKKQVPKNQIHAAIVSSLTTGKIICLRHLNFCRLTLWMPPAMDARGRRPVLPPLQATGYAYVKKAE